ncbi:MAG: adenylate/guanylate cyclase domain-containing protein [Pseudomonadota bacterium]
MSIAAINEQLLRAIGAGVALLSPDDLTIRFQNETFGQWFDGAVVGGSLKEVMPDLDFDAVVAGLAEEGRFDTEANIRRKRRRLVVALTFTRTDAEVLLLECQNITRIRELETMIETYSSMVERNTREIEREKERVEKLLLNIMPRNVYEEYKTFGVVTPQQYDPVSVISVDFADFDSMADQVGPSVMVSEMNDIYASFDRIGEQFGCERIKTVGDAYIGICGLPEPLENHTAAAVNSALRFVRYLKRRNETHDHAWLCRVGIASGSVIGSVVGIQKYVYDVFGPAVNLAQRLREQAAPLEIVGASISAADLNGECRIVSRGESELQGFGNVETSTIQELTQD